jgi:hypothetical protein
MLRFVAKQQLLILPRSLSPCSREKILLCTEKEIVNAGGLASTGSKRIMFTNRAILVAAQHLVSPFSSPFCRVKSLNAYGL